MKKRKFRTELGISLVEIIAVLGVVSLLLATLVPVVINYLDDAKFEKATGDVKEIVRGIVRLTQDVRHVPFYTNGTQTAGPPDIDLLRSPGNDPLDRDSGDKWLPVGVATGELEDHLIKNAPGGNKYASTGRFPWRGPYLAKMTEDPWRHRYLVNIGNADPADATPKVVWVCSAGPNGKIETDPNAPADSGPTPVGDDICIRLK